MICSINRRSFVVSRFNVWPSGIKHNSVRDDDDSQISKHFMFCPNQTDFVKPIMVEMRCIIACHLGAQIFEIRATAEKKHVNADVLLVIVSKVLCAPKIENRLISGAILQHIYYLLVGQAPCFPA